MNKLLSSPKPFPRRIICMTEESVETLYDLGEQERIVGVSGYVKRPKEAQDKPVISAFTHANIKKISALKPDLILGYSDIQKDIAQELIGLGFNVFIANHRSLKETLEYIIALASLVDQRDKARSLVQNFQKEIVALSRWAHQIPKKPKIYFEEWPEPMISGIRWVSELIELCGGIDIFSNRSHGVLAKERFVQSEEVLQADPDIIIGCWCGKKVDLDAFKRRPGWANLKAVKNNNIVEVMPEVFLQPGPALFKEAMSTLKLIIGNWCDSKDGNN